MTGSDCWIREPTSICGFHFFPISLVDVLWICVDPNITKEWCLTRPVGLLGQGTSGQWSVDLAGHGCNPFHFFDVLSSRHLQIFVEMKVSFPPQVFEESFFQNKNQDCSNMIFLRTLTVELEGIVVEEVQPSEFHSSAAALPKQNVYELGQVKYLIALHDFATFKL